MAAGRIGFGVPTRQFMILWHVGMLIDRTWAWFTRGSLTIQVRPRYRLMTILIVDKKRH